MSRPLSRNEQETQHEDDQEQDYPRRMGESTGGCQVIELEPSVRVRIHRIGFYGELGFIDALWEQTHESCSPDTLPTKIGYNPTGFRRLQDDVRMPTC